MSTQLKSRRPADRSRAQSDTEPSWRDQADGHAEATDRVEEESRFGPSEGDQAKFPNRGGTTTTPKSGGKR